MKKICVRVLFFIFSFINLSFADMGTYGGSVIKINCIPELSTIEFIQNELADAIDYYEWDENKLNQAKQNNYFFTDNNNRDDKFFETKCIIDNDTYTIKIESGYRYLETVVSVDILKNNNPVINNMFLTSPIISYGHRNYLFNFSYNTATQEINSIIEYPYEEETIHGLLTNDKQIWGTINIKELNPNDELLNKPENWHEFDLSQKQIALFVDCNPLLEIAEVRTIPHNKQNFTADEITELNKKGIYPLINNKLPEKISKQCNFDNNDYTIKLDKNGNLTLLQDNSAIIKDINFLAQNENIVYFLYQTYESMKIFSYKNNKFAMCRNEKINNLHNCLNQNSYYSIPY